MWQDFYGEYKYRKLHINIRTKFSYKIGCNLRLQPYSKSFYWRKILTNLSLDYIFFLYSSYLQNF